MLCPEMLSLLLSEMCQTLRCQSEQALDPYAAKQHCITMA